MLAIDRHAWTNRWHARHPLEKLLPALGMMLVALVMPPWPTAPLVIAVMVTLAVAGAGVPAAAVLGTLAVPLGFLLTGVPVLALAVDVSDGLRVGLAPGGLEMAAAVTSRSLAATSCLVFLILTTPMADLVPLLARIGVPRLVRDLILLMYRLIFIFLDCAITGRQAQVGRLGYDGPRRSLRSVGWLAGSLFQRSLDRGRRLETGLAARGFTGDLPQPSDGRTPSPVTLLAGVALPLAVACAAWLGPLEYAAWAK
jgi:cobalt/nickel transport system permease protein